MCSEKDTSTTDELLLTKRASSVNIVLIYYNTNSERKRGKGAVGIVRILKFLGLFVVIRELGIMDIRQDSLNLPSCTVNETNNGGFGVSLNSLH